MIKFQELIARLFQCCQERMQYQCERFQLPDAEFRCLGLFGEERYLTAKSIAHRMNVVKSRVSKIIDGLIKKKLIQRIKDPEDSRIQLLSLTAEGQKKINEINGFLEDVYSRGPVPDGTRSAPGHADQSGYSQSLDGGCQRNDGVIVTVWLSSDFWVSSWIGSRT